MKRWIYGLVLLWALWAIPIASAQDSQGINLQDGATATGNGGVVIIPQTDGAGAITHVYNSLGLEITISDTATVAFEGNMYSGGTYNAVQCKATGSTTLATTATTSGAYQCNVAGLYSFRARISAYTGGTVSVKGQLSTAVFAGGASGGGSITITEEDDDPDVTGVTELRVPNGLLTDNGSGSVSLASPATPTLQNVVDQGRVVDDATSEANGVCIGGDADTKRLCIWHDATTGLHVLPDVAANTRTEIMTNFTWCLFDVEGDSCTITYDPDAATQNGKLQFSANYKPIASIVVALSPRGAATMTETNIVSNQPKSWWGTLTDVDTDAFDFSFPVTAKMVGATTATIRLLGVSDNATPSGNIDLDCAMSTYTPGTDTFAAHVTTNEVTVLLTPATQNRPVATTSAAHTINGTLVDGDIMQGSCEVDATATTSAQLSDFFLWGFATIQLSVNSISD